MMKLALLVLVAAALAAPSIAAADTPQGQLNGAANVGADAFLTTSTVLDGGMSYVGAENDLSGSCAGDSGQFLFGRPGSARLFDVVCAHYVASSKCCPTGAPKMRFASRPHSRTPRRG